MRLGLLAVCAAGVARTVFADSLGRRATVDSYVLSEGPIALNGVLANIGPSGSQSLGAAPGIVLASPSQANPDYVFAWIRDSSLVFKTLIDRFVSGRDPGRLALIQQFVQSQATLQQTPNPSGAAGGAGLGEPKFNINATAFTGPWGRPQRDGPALRATALITLSNYLIAQQNTSYVTGTLFPMITLDLNYVAANWNQETFDLWEELDGNSFFTTAVQHRALREGIALANTLGQTSNVGNWQTQANSVLCFLQSYWQAPSAYVLSNTQSTRSGLDANSLLASIHTFSSNAGCDDLTFQPCSDRALANHFAVVNSFRGLYSISASIASNAAVPIGRYKEDVYFNGNPWYLCTFAAAEQLYLALWTWNNQNSITVTSLSQPFFEQFLSSVTPGTYSSSTSQYSTLTSAIRAYADGFVALNQQYTPANGGLSEQYSKTDGTPTSAVDLTWSYASALTAFDARNGTISAAWPASGLSVASSCIPGTATITFIVNATTVFGQNIYLTGSIPELESWSPDTALGPLANPNYPLWQITVTVPSNTAIQYKYINKDGSGNVIWESDPNNSITSPATGGSVTLDDTWR